MIFIEFDLSAAELHVLAREADETKMIGVLESGEDPHVATASFMFGTPKDIIKKEEKLLGHSTDSAEIQRVRELQVPEIFDQSNFPPVSTMTLRQAGKKCLTPDHEVLTPNGWIRIDEFDWENDLLAQWENGEVTFVKASALHIYEMED